MNYIALTLAAAALALSGCNAKEETIYKTDLEMAEVMGHVVDFGAQAFWRSAGYIDTAEGTTSLTPTTEEGWLNAVGGAATVAEGANLLMLPDRRQDEGDWVKLANDLYARSREGMQAANDGEAAWIAIQKAKDANTTDAAAQAKLAEAEIRMFDTGGRMFQVCVACHEKYLLPFLDEDGQKTTKAPLPNK